MLPPPPNQDFAMKDILGEIRKFQVSPEDTTTKALFNKLDAAEKMINALAQEIENLKNK